MKTNQLSKAKKMNSISNKGLLKEELRFYLDCLVLEIGEQVTEVYEYKHGIWEGMSVSNSKTKEAYLKKLIEVFEQSLLTAKQEAREEAYKEIGILDELTKSKEKK